LNDQSPAQFAFIEGAMTYYNILLSQDLVESMAKRPGGRGDGTNSAGATIKGRQMKLMTQVFEQTDCT